MLGLLSAGTSSIKAYFYGAVIAVFLSMLAYIWYLNGRVETLSANLATAEMQLATSKSLIAKMTGAAEISDAVDLYIDTGLSITLGEHDNIQDQLRKEYEAYLMESQKEAVCQDYCKEQNNGSCPIGDTGKPPKPPIPGGNTKDDIIKKKMLEAAWKNYCLNDRKAEGCQ